MDFDLKKLTDWCPRAAGDRAVRNRETQVSDGTGIIVLGNDGGISVASVSVDGTPAVAGDYTISGNVITFATDPVEAANIVIVYTCTRYTDLEVQQFLGDATDAVGADIHMLWSVNKNSCKLTIDPAISPKTLTQDQTDMDPRVRELIVYRAAVEMYGDKANTAADRAILVKDGDTTIDTSKTSGASEKAIKRVTDRYTTALKTFRSEVFCGKAGEVFREQVITWGLNPLWGNRS